MIVPYKTGKARGKLHNGDKAFPKEQILKLSDSYLEKSDNPMLELSVKVLNINLLEHESEAINMLFTEFNMDDAKAEENMNLFW